MKHDLENFSWTEMIINKGPFPNAQSSTVSRVLNTLIFSCILPVIGYVYAHFYGVELLNVNLMPQRFSSEIIVATIAVFLFSYTYLLYDASQKVKRYLQEIKDTVAYTDEIFQTFKRDTARRILNPPYALLILLLITVPIGFSEVLSNPIYTGDSIISILIELILIFSTFLNWSGSWMLFSFLRTSKRFGKDVPLRINPFDPDRIGGLAPLSALSTFAIFAVGLLSTISIPLWYIFSPSLAIVWVFITSILIPCYFFYSMSGVYTVLKKEKENSLKELNDEFRYITEEIRKFISIDHEKKGLDEKRLTRMGETLNAVNIIYERMKSMHTFPINSEIIVKIVLSAILPILGILADFLAVQSQIFSLI